MTRVARPVAPERCHLQAGGRGESPAWRSTSGLGVRGAGGAGSALRNEPRVEAQAEIAGECHNFHLISIICLIPVLIPFLLTIKDFLLIKSCTSSLPTNEKLHSRKNSVDSTGTEVCILTHSLSTSFPLSIPTLWAE